MIEIYRIDDVDFVFMGMGLFMGIVKEVVDIFR